MPESNVQDTPVEETLDASVQSQATDELVTDDLLVEEVSIDGMCGVY